MPPDGWVYRIFIRRNLSNYVNCSCQSCSTDHLTFPLVLDIFLTVQFSFLVDPDQLNADADNLNAESSNLDYADPDPAF